MRKNIIKSHTLPTISEGMVLYAVQFLMLIYFGSLLQVHFKLGGIALTQLIIIVLTLAFAYYIRADFKQVFAIKLPELREVLGGASLWFGGFIISNLIAELILYLFPQNMEVAEALSETLFLKGHLLLNLAVIALLPSLCEEIFYRGFLVTAFKAGGSDRLAISLSSILFGFMHMDFIRVIPTAILGYTLAYAAVKTGSLFVPMLMHFLNNGLTIIAAHYPKSCLGKAWEYIEIDFSRFDLAELIILIIISGAAGLLGILLLKGKRSQKRL